MGITKDFLNLQNFLLDVKMLASVEDLYDYCKTDTYQDETAELVNEHEATRNNKLSISRLRSAWRAAKKHVEEADRRVPGSTEEDIEAPLDDDEITQIEKDWRGAYAVIVCTYLTLAYTLVARLFRKFRRVTPTVINARKIKFLAGGADAARWPEHILG